MQKNHKEILQDFESIVRATESYISAPKQFDTIVKSNRIGDIDGLIKGTQFYKNYPKRFESLMTQEDLISQKI